MMSCNTLDIYCDQKEVSRLNLRLAPRGVPSPLRPIIFERKAFKVFSSNWYDLNALLPCRDGEVWKGMRQTEEHIMKQNKKTKNRNRKKALLFVPCMTALWERRTRELRSTAVVALMLAHYVTFNCTIIQWRKERMACAALSARLLQPWKPINDPVQFSKWAGPPFSPPPRNGSLACNIIRNTLGYHLIYLQCAHMTNLARM